MSGPHLSTLLVLVLALGATWTAALVSVIRTARVPARRALWAFALVLLPVLGPCLWLVAGRRIERPAMD